MQVGVFIPIGNNGWLISTTSPQYKPTFDLNREVVQKAERYGFDFALSMIKLHGFGGPSGFWDYNLESFTLMAGLASVTSRIQLFATCAVLTMPPPFAARMAVTIDSISKGRFGVNIISGWQRREYTQMGIWPGAEHYRRRYDYCAEYVAVMRELWAKGQSDFKGDFFQMDDCRLLPMPTGNIPIICAGQSDAGTRFASTYCEYNFCSGGGVNQPRSVEPSVARLVAANAETGNDCGALILQMVIADETDEAAMAKWEHYKAGTDLEALAHRDAQAYDDPNVDPYSTKNRRRTMGVEHLPTNQGVFVGSYATVARLLDEQASVPGVRGVMLTFDDFLIGMEQFGQRIQPLMKSRAAALAA
jgi:pyrimidine oxygenase